MSKINTVVKARILEIVDIYPDGQYLARVEEIPVVDNAVFKLTKDVTSFEIDGNGTLVNGKTIPEGTELKLMQCGLSEYLSKFKYEYTDENGVLQNEIVMLTDAYLEHISGNLGVKV